MTAPAKVRPTTGTKTATRTATRTATDRATLTQPRQPRPATAPRPVRWLVGPTPRRAPRTPFVLLIIGLLVFGLVGLLLLNTATASASFRERSLQDRNNALTLRQQALQREVSGMDAPQALAKAAAGLGMVPGPDPVFLELLKNGSSKVIGDPSATADPVPPPPAPTSTPTHKATTLPTTQPTKSTQHKATQQKTTSKPMQHKTTSKPTPSTASSPPAHHTTASQHQQAHGGHR